MGVVSAKCYHNWLKSNGGVDIWLQWDLLTWIADQVRLPSFTSQIAWTTLVEDLLERVTVIYKIMPTGVQNIRGDT